ncbi:uncharacterized protein DS421_11g330580 [Arachis hypogaea]|nr:uncharacterized protein DS421_11g330580 [Arachis hypogaea]
MNPIEHDIVHTLLDLWDDNPLGLRMILADVQASEKTIVKMTGEIEAIAAMRQKLDNKKLQESIKSLEEDKNTSASQVKDLMKEVAEKEKNNSTLAKTAENVERAASDVIFYAEKNIFNQIKLLAPELDIFSVSAFKKVVDGQVVDIM